MLCNQSCGCPTAHSAIAAQHTTAQSYLLLCRKRMWLDAAQQGSAALVLAALLLLAAPFLCFAWYSWHSALCHAFQAVLRQAAPQKRTCDNVIERIYAPDESNIIPQCSAGPGGTRPDLLVLQVGQCAAQQCGCSRRCNLVGCEACNRATLNGFRSPDKSKLRIFRHCWTRRDPPSPPGTLSGAVM
jgi:hypothetical protein